MGVRVQLLVDESNVNVGYGQLLSGKGDSVVLDAVTAEASGLAHAGKVSVIEVSEGFVEGQIEARTEENQD